MAKQGGKINKVKEEWHKKDKMVTGIIHQIVMFCVLSFRVMVLMPWLNENKSFEGLDLYVYIVFEFFTTFYMQIDERSPFTLNGLIPLVQFDFVVLAMQVGWYAVLFNWYATIELEKFASILVFQLLSVWKPTWWPLHVFSNMAFQRTLIFYSN